MSVLDGLTGIVFVAILGSLFVITCFISSVKAVRDRFRIKKRRAKRLLNQPDLTKTTFYENNRLEVPIPCTSQLHKSTSASFSSCISDMHDKIDSSVYSSTDVGENNISFKHNNTDMKVNEEYPNTGIKISYNGKRPRRTKSHDINCQRKRHIDQLPADCLSIKKLMRSHSYELAVYENSWMPFEKQYVPILKVYNQPEDDNCRLQSSEAAFINKAYD